LLRRGKPPGLRRHWLGPGPGADGSPAPEPPGGRLLARWRLFEELSQFLGELRLALGGELADAHLPRVGLPVCFFDVTADQLDGRSALVRRPLLQVAAVPAEDRVEPPANLPPHRHLDQLLTRSATTVAGGPGGPGQSAAAPPEARAPDRQS